MSKEAMKLAAEFNRYFTSMNRVDVPERVSVPRNEWRVLFDALAEQPTQQEPVGEVFINTGYGKVFAPMKDIRWKDGMMPKEGTLLYTSPPANCKPLTERELMKCITQVKCFDTVKMTYESGPYEIDRPTLKAFEFARAIEAAHGIKENT